jgi:hypothetical protein
MLVSSSADLSDEEDVDGDLESISDEEMIELIDEEFGAV